MRRTRGRGVTEGPEVRPCPASRLVLLSLGVLQVMSQGVRVDQSSTGARRFWETPAHPESALLDAPDDLRPLELGPTVGRETPETTHAADGEDR